jgi:hypothetical protein
VGQGPAASGGAGAAGAEAVGAPQETAAPALPGAMLFQDGPRHTCLAGQPPLDLIVTHDDATSEVYSGFLVEEEGAFSSFRGLAETIGRHGLFCSLYTDRGSHDFFTPEAGGAVAKDQPT